MSEEEEEESNDEEQMHLNTRFARGYDSEEEEEVKRVVVSHKEKQEELLTDVVGDIRDYANDDDWVQLLTGFDKLNKQLEKWKKANKGQIVAPRVYFRGLEIIEKKIEATDPKKAKADKTMDGNHYRAFNSLRQRFKKTLKTVEKQYENYKNTDSADEEDDDDEVEEEAAVDEDDDEEEAAPAKEKPSAADSDDDSPVVSSGASKWLKSDDEDEDDTKVAKKKKRTRKRKPAAAKAAAAPVEKKEEWTEERVTNELKEISGGRSGKKKLDRQTQLVKLSELLPKAKTVPQELAIRQQIVSTRFDMNISMKQHIDRPVWLEIHSEVMTMLDILEKNRDVVLQDSLPSSTTDDDEETEKEPLSSRLVAFLQRLGDEMIKAYRSTDPHSEEYIERLGDEELFLNLAARVHKYYSRVNLKAEVAQVALERMTFVHYRRDEQPVVPLGASEDLSLSNSDADAASASAPSKVDRSALMEKLATIVFNYGEQRMKSQALLYIIYHHALEDRFYEARDLLLMSHMQDQIQHADVRTQILYNRATAQLGLSAFRIGRIWDAHSCLSDLYQSNRVKELLAQGITARYGERNTEQEKVEKQRQMPYHMHINLELLECVHLISAMLLETTNITSQGFNSKRKVISRPFRRLMDIFDRQIFAGPPESPRDHVIASARALRDAEWEQSYAYVCMLNCWRLLPNPEGIKEMLKKNIKEVALQTYVLKFSRAFASLNVEVLCNMFDLPVRDVHCILSKMMISEELHSSWHQPSGTVVMHRVEPNRLQQLVLQYSEKLENFINENEKQFDARTGGFGYEKRAGNFDGGEGGDRSEGGRGRGRDNNRRGGGRGDGGRGGGYNNNRNQDRNNNNRNQDRNNNNRNNNNNNNNKSNNTGGFRGWENRKSNSTLSSSGGGFQQQYRR